MSMGMTRARAGTYPSCSPTTCEALLACALCNYYDNNIPHFCVGLAALRTLGRATDCSLLQLSRAEASLASRCWLQPLIN